MPIIRSDERQFLVSNNFKLIPLARNSKIPLEKAWEKSLLSASDFLSKYENDDINIGLITGSGIVDVDLDIPSHYLPFARSFFPPPAAAFGRASKPASHYLYYCSDEPAFQVIKSGVFSVEFRCSPKHQTMIPPSVHPSGESVIWSAPVDFSKILSDSPSSSHSILLGIRLFVAACVLADVWPIGARHQASLALTGMMLRVNDNYPGIFTSKDAIVDFVKIVAEMAGDDEIHDRVLAAKDTLKRWGNEETKLIGGQTLDKLLGKDTVKSVRQLLVDDDTFDAIEEMNKQFAVTLVGDKIAILWEDEQIEHKFKLMGIDAFRTITASHKHITTRGGKQKIVLLSDVWLRHSARRTYKNGLSFSPPGGPTVPESYNLFTGWKYQPVFNPPKVNRFIDHLYNNIAGGDDRLYHWVMSFFADMIQKPARLPGVALVLRGKQGVGKTFVGNVIAELLNPYSISISSPHSLLHNFNAHLQNKLLVVSNEAFFAGDRANTGKLKSIITDPHITIERKGFDPISSNNCMRLLMTTNAKWVVPAEADERRYVVINVGERNQQDLEYFAGIDVDLINGGYSALMYMLSEYKYDEHELRRTINTEAIQEQKRMSASPVLAWWAECLENRQAALILPEWAARGPSGEQSSDDWPHAVSKEALYSDFVLHSQKNRYISVDRSTFWSEFRNLIKIDGFSVANYRYTVHSNGRDAITGQTWDGKRRMDFITVPPFEAAVARFELIADFKLDVSKPSNVIELPTKTKREF